MKLDKSRGPKSLALPIILILVAILIFHLNIYSGNLSLVLLLFSSLFGLAEIIRNIRSSSVSAMSYGNVWVLISLMLIFVVAPIVRIITKSQLPLVFARRDTSTYVNQVNSLASIAILGVILGSRIYWQARREKRTSKYSGMVENSRPSLALSIVLFFFWSALYIYWALNQGDSFAAIFGSRSFQRTAGVIKSNGYLVDSLYGALGVVTAWLAYSVREGNTRLTKKLLTASLAFVIPSFLQGDRSKSIFFILVVLMILNGWKTKVKKIYIVIAILLVPILVVAPRVYRQSQDGLSSVGLTAFSVTNVVETFTKEDTAMAPTLAILLENLGTNIPYQYGKSYLNLVAKPVPRSLWPGKPIEFDTQMMIILFPTYAASGVGFAFSAISEPLVNFGLTGVLVFFIGLGIFNRRNYEKLISKKTSISIFLNAWLAGFMFILIRGNLSVDFQRAVFPIVSGIIVLYFHNARAKIFSKK